MATPRLTMTELWTSRLYDALRERWEAPSTRRWTAWSLVGAMFLSVASIELARLGILPSLLGHPLPTNHLAAISWVFTLLLITEVLDLVFGLSESVANALGKQLEIFSLVLLRKAFDELPHLPEPLAITGESDVVLTMAAEVGASLLIFGLLVLYYRRQDHVPISSDPVDLRRFVAMKKAVCLGLLAAFVLTLCFFGLKTLTVSDPAQALSLDFFEVYYTILVFADLAIVLASLVVTREYNVVFRNFAFAAVTVFLRLALSAEPYLNAVLGIGAAMTALAVAYVYQWSLVCNLAEPRDGTS